MLKQRVITAVVLVILVLAALFASNPVYWQVFINIAIALGFWEWLRFCGITDRSPQLLAFVVWFAVAWVLQTGLLPFQASLVVLCLLWLVLFAFTMTDWLNRLHHVACKLPIGIFTINMAGLIVIKLQTLEYGPLWVLCFFVCVWAADIGAYFVGRRFGKTKLAPSISPGKTVEGLLGGVGFAALLFFPLIFWLFPLSAAVLLLITIMITVLVSVIGDLFESKLKRYVDLKDSSQILPGHGGVLDRIDSLLSGAPFFAMGLVLLGYLS